PIATYRYDAQLRRVYAKSTFTNKETHFLFGPSGELLAEVNAQGFTERAWAYLDGEPLALVLHDENYASTPPPLAGCASVDGNRVALIALCGVLILAGRRRKQGWLLLVVFAVHLPTC